MDKTEIIKIIEENAPRSGADAKFMAYGHIWHDILFGDNEHAPECAGIINDAIGDARDELYVEHDIAVQLDAVREGVRGIRIMMVD